MKKIFVFVLLAMSVALAGCNTMEGLGKDIQELGKTIEDKTKE